MDPNIGARAVGVTGAIAVADRTAAAAVMPLGGVLPSPPMSTRSWLHLGVASAVALGAACSSISTVRLQPDQIAVAPGLRPLAAIQADVISAYLLFVPVPGGVDLDRAVNRMLIVAAKTMGADKIVDLRFSVTPEHGIYALRRLLGWRSAHASGIAVQIVAPPTDGAADQGPEPAPAP